MSKDIWSANGKVSSGIKFDLRGLERMHECLRLWHDQREFSAFEACDYKLTWLLLSGVKRTSLCLFTCIVLSGLSSTRNWCSPVDQLLSSAREHQGLGPWGSSLVVSLLLNSWQIDSVWYKLEQVRWDTGEDAKRLQKKNYWLLWLFQNWLINKIKRFKFFNNNWVEFGVHSSHYMTVQTFLWALVLERHFRETINSGYLEYVNHQIISEMESCFGNFLCFVKTEIIYLWETIFLGK